GTAPFRRIQCSAALVSRPPEKAMPTFWPAGRCSRMVLMGTLEMSAQQRCDAMGCGRLYGRPRSAEVADVVVGLGDADVESAVRRHGEPLTRGRAHPAIGAGEAVLAAATHALH